jgi:hypothetical protein
MTEENTKISLNFKVVEFSEIPPGDYFLWGGQLHQKIQTCEIYPQTPQEREWEQRNAVRVLDGELVFYWPADPAFPVKVNINVKQ